MRQIVPVALTVVVVVALGYLIFGSSPGSAPTAVTAPQPIPAPAAAKPSDPSASRTIRPLLSPVDVPEVAPGEPPMPPEAFEELQIPIGVWVTMRIPRVTTGGIACGDGTFLPTLNGVENPPAINRQKSLGPVPPVVAVAVDRLGHYWYMHEDGSSTTTRPVTVTLADGTQIQDVQTVHSERMPDDRMVQQPGAPGGPPAGGVPATGGPPPNSGQAPPTGR